MKKVIILVSFVLCFSIVSAQDQGIGLRLGTPTGVTYKKYLAKSNAIEFGIGTAGIGWHHNYYHNSFHDHGPFNDFRYRSHTVQGLVYLQGRYLFHKNIYVQGLEGKWDWYWGVGAALKIAKVKYYFDNNETGIYNDLDLGPEGIGGMEYTFEGVPITVFADLSLMLEIVDRVSIRPLSGVGARYRF